LKILNDMASVFTKIIQRELPAYVVYEDNKCIAFLDINPLAKGHTLVVPKVEVDYLFDVDEETYAHLWKIARQIARAIDQCGWGVRVGIAVLGLEVPHAHIHLVPISSLHDLDFSNPKLKLTTQEFQDIQHKIVEALQKM